MTGLGEDIYEGLSEASDGVNVMVEAVAKSRWSKWREEWELVQPQSVLPTWEHIGAAAQAATLRCERAALESLGIPLSVLAALKAGNATVVMADYGCHCDLEPGHVPDGCVIDEDRRDACLFAKKYKVKEDCPEWKKFFAFPKTPEDMR